MLKNEKEEKNELEYMTRNIVLLIAIFISTGIAMIYLTYVELNYGSIIQSFGIQWMIIGIVLFLNKNKKK